jgi:hypothetical protein
LGGGLWSFIVRSFLKSKRPFTIDVRTPQGVEVLRLERPWRWFFSRLEVWGAGSKHLGSIQQRFRIFTRLYDVLSPSGVLLSTLEGPLLKPWTFFVRRNGNDVGAIRKRWSGIGKEMFTDADNFGVELSASADPQLRQLILAATFLIDFVHFERTD